MPLSLDRRNGRPLYQTIAEAIEADVVSGRLQAGDRLPTHRDLAYRVGVTVGTISRAYAEACRAGWIAGEVGRGTYVLNRRARFPSRAREAAVDVIDLRLNEPIVEPQPDLKRAFAALLSRKDQPLLSYAPIGGTLRDRQVGAAVLARHGLTVDPDAVVLSAGAQHGVGLALETLTQPGDSILVEDLSYPVIRELAQARGLRVHPVAIDHDSVSRALGAACRAVGPKVLYVNPTLHNPTGRTLMAARRQSLADVARRHGLMIIEDDVHRLLAPDAPAPIAQLLPEQTVYVASLSKCFAPGLRLGYMAAPDLLRERLADAMWRSLWSVSPILTALAAHWVEAGDLDRVVAGKRREAQARQSMAARIFSTVEAPTSAYHYWLALPARWSAEAFALAAQAAGVLVTPSGAFHVGSGPPPRAVRLSLSAPKDRATLRAALERLKDIAGGSSPAISSRSL